MKPELRYTQGAYLEQNPNWHREDALWKAEHVARILKSGAVNPASICEIGCGAGDVLVHLSAIFPDATLSGVDISPQAAAYWRQHSHLAPRVSFEVAALESILTRRFDVVMMLDVFEHVRDPFSFLESARSCGGHFVFHIPLDLSASSVARKHPLLHARRSIGHLHYYTKDLALETLTESGYEILDWRYTGAAFNSPDRSLKTRLAALPRRLLYAINRDLGVRLLGGDTLLVLARPASAAVAA